MPRKRRRVGCAAKEGSVCTLCRDDSNSEMEMGKLYVLGPTAAFHHYCLLFSSGLSQEGEDEEGILGFLEPNIKQEVARGKRLHCTYCGRVGATVGCFNGKCRRSYHMPCGLKNDAQFSFQGEFRTWCSQHRDYQDGSGARDISECPICMEDLLPCSADAVWAPCCRRDSWFHRACAQRLAISAGYYFKCPLCNDKNTFVASMQQFGVYVPEKDASWELEPNAYEDLLERPVTCEAPICLCPSGRNFDKENTPWDVVYCQLCGSQGIHKQCKTLLCCRVDSDWHCVECTTLLTECSSREKAARKKKQREAASEGSDGQSPREGTQETGASSSEKETGDNDEVVCCDSEEEPVVTLRKCGALKKENLNISSVSGHENDAPLHGKKLLPITVNLSVSENKDENDLTLIISSESDSDFENCKTNSTKKLSKKRNTPKSTLKCWKSKAHCSSTPVKPELSKVADGSIIPKANGSPIGSPSNSKDCDAIRQKEGNEKLKTNQLDDSLAADTSMNDSFVPESPAASKPINSAAYAELADYNDSIISDMLKAGEALPGALEDIKQFAVSYEDSLRLYKKKLSSVQHLVELTSKGKWKLPLSVLHRFLDCSLVVPHMVLMENILAKALVFFKAKYVHNKESYSRKMVSNRGIVTGFKRGKLAMKYPKYVVTEAESELRLALEVDGDNIATYNEKYQQLEEESSPTQDTSLACDAQNDSIAHNSSKISVSEDAACSEHNVSTDNNEAFQNSPTPLRKKMSKITPYKKIKFKFSSNSKKRHASSPSNKVVAEEANVVHTTFRMNSGASDQMKEINTNITAITDIIIVDDSMNNSHVEIEFKSSSPGNDSMIVCDEQINLTNSTSQQHNIGGSEAADIVLPLKPCVDSEQKLLNESGTLPSIVEETESLYDSSICCIGDTNQSLGDCTSKGTTLKRKIGNHEPKLSTKPEQSFSDRDSLERSQCSSSFIDLTDDANESNDCSPRKKSRVKKLRVDDDHKENRANGDDSSCAEPVSTDAITKIAVKKKRKRKDLYKTKDLHKTTQSRITSFFTR